MIFCRFLLEPCATKAQKQNLKKESRDPQRTSWLLRCAIVSYCSHVFRNHFRTLHVHPFFVAYPQAHLVYIYITSKAPRTCKVLGGGSRSSNGNQPGRATNPRELWTWRRAKTIIIFYETVHFVQQKKWHALNRLRGLHFSDPTTCKHHRALTEFKKSKNLK